MNRVLTALTLALLVLVLACPVWAAPKVIKVSMINPEGDPAHLAVRDGFKKYLEEKTDGRYRVDVYPSSTLGNADTAFQGAQFGSLHMVIETTSNLTQFVPEFAVVDMPFILPDRESIDYVFKEAAIGKKLLGFLEKKGVKPLSADFSTFRTIDSRMPINTAEDAKGKKIRTTLSKWHMTSIASLGFSPTPMAAAEVITGLQQGVVDGADFDLIAVLAYRMGDVIKYVLRSEHIGVIYVLFANPAWWDSIPAADKPVFEEAVREYTVQFNERHVKQEAVTAEVLEKEYNMVISSLSPEQKEIWRKNGNSAYEKLPRAYQDLAAEIRAAVDEFKKK